MIDVMGSVSFSQVSDGNSETVKAQTVLLSIQVFGGKDPGKITLNKETLNIPAEKTVLLNIEGQYPWETEDYTIQCNGCEAIVAVLIVQN
jgi:hypothetical protein